MAEFQFTTWFHGLNKRIVALMDQNVDPATVEIQVQHPFYMNLMYNAQPGSGLSIEKRDPEHPMTLHWCKIVPCLQSADPYYRIVVDGIIFYERTEL